MKNNSINIEISQVKTSSLGTMKKKIPFIFTKKVNDKYKVISLNTIKHQLGQTRHFPPANREWYNSIYTYNNNSIKSLPAADKSLNNLIKSYFNLFPRIKSKYKRIPIRFRRLSPNKIFLSKADLKHTSNKVVITLYVFDAERRHLVREIKKLKTLKYINPSKRLLNKKNRDLTLIKRDMIFDIPSVNPGYEVEAKKLKLYLDNFNEFFNIFNEFNTNFDNDTYLFFDLMIESLGEKLTINILNDLMFVKTRLDELMPWIIDKHYVMRTIFEKELRSFHNYSTLLRLNSSKFEVSNFSNNLNYLISKIYNKEVELNIVNLKTLYLNSDILTQAIALKLKNRDNRLLRVLRRSLLMVKLPKINRIIEKYGKGISTFASLAPHAEQKNKGGKQKEQLLLNNVLATHGIGSDSKPVLENKDTVNQLLLDNFPYEKKVNKYVTTSYNTLSDIIINSLKYKSIGGVRLEAGGRLTRRFTASRSVFKIRWKGSLKNIDSSYKGLSSVILRGHVKSNVQYSLINSKTRNGSFGIRGWVSGK